MAEKIDGIKPRPTLVLKSRAYTGILYTEGNLAVVHGKKIPLKPNMAISPGDTILLENNIYVVLEPNPVFFKDFADRGAQIIQPWDAAALIAYTNIHPGMNVLESGAGSGALSFSILSSLGGSGMLVTVERDERYVTMARNNVEAYGEFKNWRLLKGDVSNIKLDILFDAAVLDIPEPWNVLHNVSSYLKPGSMLSCYLPTYNQVERTVMSFESSGFYHLETFELMKRDLLVRESAVRPDNNIIGHTAFLVFGIRTSGMTFK